MNMKEDMVTIQIEAGCPSGRSEHDEIGFWNRINTVSVHKDFVIDFIDNIMVYANQQAIAPHWQYYNEEE
jgi:hypothetical protein